MRWTWLVIAAATAALACSLSGSVAATPVAGRVDVPTFATPAVARLVYIAEPSLNGELGWVFELPATSGSFTLTLTGGTTGFEDIDITFYADLEPVSETTGSFAHTGDEQGEIPAGSRYAVVTLAAGAQATFVYAS